MKTKKLFIALAASVALHAAVPASVEITKAVAPRFKDLIERVDSEIDKMKIERARKKLIAKARKDIKNGQFNLGKFILDAEKIDAEEKGDEYKYEEALGKLEKKISELQDIVEKGYNVQRAVPKILPEFDYYGFSMGSTGDAIIENGGNCEAISHYIVSIVHGAGYKENVYFRVYSDHVAPVFVDKGVEYDLSGGNYAQLRGVKFAPEKLVDFYAIKHGLEEGEIISRDSLVASAKEHVEKKKEGSFPYPHTDEAHSGGSTPIFAQHGVKEFSPTDDELDSDGIQNESNRYYADRVSPDMEALNFVPYRFNPLDSYSTLVEPVYEKEQDYIDRLMNAIEHYTGVLQTIDEKPERIMYLAYLSGLYFDAYHQLSLLGKTTAAEEVFRQREETIKEAEKIFESITDKEKFAKKLIMISLFRPVNLWHLVYLGEDGADFLFGVMHPGATYDEYMYFALEDSLLALSIYPPTRERAEKKMQEWIHTFSLEHYDMVDMPSEYRDLDKMQWFFELCGGSYNVEDLIRYDYPPASRVTFETHPDLLPYETEPPEFRKLLKSIKKYRWVDDECKKKILLRWGTEAIWTGIGFYPGIAGPPHASEHDAEVKFAKEFKKWLDGVELDDPEARKTAEFMKEHIKKKYGF